MRGNQRWGAIAAVSLGQMMATLFYALPAVAQLNFGFGQRASDGTVYEVIAVNNSALAGGVDQMRITTVSGSINGINACSSGGAGVGQPMTAASGADPMSPAVLHPYDQVLRTGVLTPNNFTVTFDANNGGRLTIGTGVGAFDVCRNVSDCVAGAGDASVFTLSTPGGGIPAACIANGVTASCAGSAMLSTFAFGLNASGDPPTCSTLPTTTTSVCANPPADGFTVQKGQVVVFIYNHSLGMQGFSYGASGFGVDINDGLICSGNLNRVVTSDGQAPSAPPPIAPVSPSPTPTATNTPTQTPTPTATPSHSPTVTATATPTLTPIPCGNGTPNPGEQCDDGNRVNGDGCDNNCTFTGCGNGVLTPGEDCDDGNLVNGDGCDNNCKPTACGNGVVTSGEQCDDGNRVNGDGCDNNCTPTGCGNGIVTPPEKCDDGNFVNGDGCDNDCIAPVCGDGVVRAPEVCDDGNLNDADGCDSNCRPTGCGNGVATGTEMCDDGNAVNGDGCENNCFLTQCLPGHPAAIPGYCGSRRNDCAQEFCTLPAPPIDNQLSLPSNVFKCKEGDPTCDATIGDRVCTFRFALCYNTSDKRAPCNNTGRIESIKFRRPNQSAPRGSYDTDNRDAIEAGLKAIGGQVQGKCHNKAKKGQACSSDAACDTMSGTGDGVCANRRVTFSPLMTTPNLCTPLIKFEVPLRLTASGVAFGRADLRIRAHEPKPGKSDGDILKFICQP